MRQFNFRTVDGQKIDNVVEYLKDCIKKDEVTNEFQLFIGCDSLPTRKDRATYSIVVCLYRVGRGAHVIYTKESGVKVYGNTKSERLKNRLWDEIYHVVDLATILTDSDLLEDSRITEFQVHLDINPDENYESNVIHNQAVGYIRSLGLDVFVKPTSPAASFCADRIARGKEKI